MATEMKDFNTKLSLYIQNTTGNLRTLLMAKFRDSVTVTSPPTGCDLVASNADGTVWLFGNSTGWAHQAVVDFVAIVGFDKSLGRWNSGAGTTQWGFASDVVYKWSDMWTQRVSTSNVDMYDPAELEG